MSFTLQKTGSLKVPINVQGVLPATTNRLSTIDVAKLPIRQGNRTVELGERFEVTRTPGSGQLRWEGDLSSVHWIGSGMAEGEIVINGPVGRHLGSQMRGGNIRVCGDAGDFVGCEMLGGQIRIEGHAGDSVGAAYPGNRSGTNRGTIIVTGNAGHGVGFALRRGTIVIGGHVGRLAGWNMLAGTIVVGQSVGPMVGKGMVRGTLLLSSDECSQENRRQLPPTFSQAGSFHPVFIQLLARWLQGQDLNQLWRTGQYQVFHGDHLKGARGEVLIATND